MSANTVMAQPRVDVTSNFITEDERIQLESFVLSNLDQFHDGIHLAVLQTKKRLSNRLSGDAIKYPKIIYDIQQRIRETLPFEHQIEPFHGKDGLVICITYDGGDTYHHYDPRSDDVLHTLRCNILVSAPESGGIVDVCWDPVDLPERGIMKYLVTKHIHGVSTTHGKRPRILFQYGFLIKESDWE